MPFIASGQAAQPFVTGPGHIFIANNVGGSPQYLGTAETSPEIEINPEETPYFNSIFSTKIPMDWCDQGEQAFTTIDLNRWDETIYRQIVSRPRFNGTRGSYAIGDFGTLVAFENYAFQVWIQFPNVAKAAMSGDGMPAGYHFFLSRVIGPDRIAPINTDPSHRRVVFHHIPLLAYGLGNLIVGTLYNHDMSALPQLV